MPNQKKGVYVTGILDPDTHRDLSTRLNELKYEGIDIKIKEAVMECAKLGLPLWLKENKISSAKAS